MLKAAVITFIIGALVVTLALCKAAGRDEKQRQWIEQRKMEEQEEKV